MAERGVIRITGLREFRMNLRRLDKSLPKGLRVAGNRAAQIIVDDARPKVPIGPGRGGHAASSIRAASTQSGARVKGGGARYPYYPWLDFGGRVGRHKSVHRERIKTGRYIWRSFAANRAKVQDELHDGLVRIAEAAGLEPRG